LALLLLKILVLNRIDSAFPGAYDLGLLVEAILASVVASYVFYIFVVHLRGHREKIIVRPYVSKHVACVVSECRSQLHEISKASGIKVSLDDASSTSITKAFGEINPFAEAPLILFPTGTTTNWLQYFAFHIQCSRESITRALALILYIDAQLVKMYVCI
jgi:hypothetical protein